jgi:hypothetical protein
LKVIRIVATGAALAGLIVTTGYFAFIAYALLITIHQPAWDGKEYRPIILIGISAVISLWSLSKLASWVRRPRLWPGRVRR